MTEQQIRAIVREELTAALSTLAQHSKSNRAYTPHHTDADCLVKTVEDIAQWNGTLQFTPDPDRNDRRGPRKDRRRGRR